MLAYGEAGDIKLSKRDDRGVIKADTNRYLADGSTTCGKPIL
jgi:hypothetical protein